MPISSKDAELRLHSLCQVLLKDQQAKVRAQAAIALGEIGDPRAIPSLCQALEDRSSQVRSAAIAALVTLEKSDTTKGIIIGLERLENLIEALIKTMSETPKFDLRGANIGNLADTVQGNQIATQHNDTPSPSLVAAIKEIQELLAQLAQTHSTMTEMAEMTEAELVEREIKHNPTFRARLLNALKQGGLEALKVTFAPIGIPIELVKGWLETEP